MKKIIILILSIFATIYADAQNFDRALRPKAGPATAVKLTEPQYFIMPNGLKVFVVENHKLPTVSYQLDVDVQPALQGKSIGYKGFIGELLKGGTKTRTKDKFNAELDALGGSLFVGEDGIFASCLTKNQEPLLALINDMILNPNFTQTELDKLKKQVISGLQNVNDDPEAMAENMSKAIIYGNKHLYGEIETVESINAITLADCQKYYTTYFRPNVSYLAVVGDITLEEAKVLVNKYFATWQKKIVPVTNYPKPAINKGAKVALANKSGAVQTVVNVSYPINLKPGTPDVVKLKVANNILGGGSSGKLFMNLREKHAWTYGSYSSVSANLLENAGTFEASANCKTEATDSAVGEILNEMNKLGTEKVDEKTLQDIKNNMAGKFALSLEDPKTIARFAINTMKDKMPKDYYTNYLKNLQAVTANDVMLVSKKYITPGVANIMVAGDKSEIAEKLKQYSTTKTIAYYDGFGKEIKTNTEEKAPLISASEVINNYLNAIGGLQNWNNLKDITVKMVTQMQGAGMITIDVVKKFPNKMLQTVKMDTMVLQEMKYDGNIGYITSMQGKKQATGDELESLKADAAYLNEGAYLSDAYTLKVTGIENIAGSDAYVVKITDKKGKVITAYYDVRSKLKVQSIESSVMQGQQMTQTTTYSDYKEIKGGLKYPFITNQQVGPQKLEMLVKSVEVNTAVQESIFR
jgi:zinc protease